MTPRGFSDGDVRRFAFGPMGTTAAGFAATLAAQSLGGSPLLSFLVGSAAAAASLGHIVARGRAEQADARRKSERSRRDALTGLAHRIAFEDSVGAALRAASASVTVLKLDLRRFRDVNDQFGRVCGDATLLEVRDRLAEALGEAGMLARTGGDEFAALLVGLDEASVATTAEAWRLAMLEPISAVGAMNVILQAAIGYASATPGANLTATELLRRADVALSAAKAGGALVIGHTPRQSEELAARKSLEADLRHALATNQLTVDFQPIWKSDGKTMVGAEALARWRHPVRGFISPLEFIGIAESSGFIDELGEYVLRRACLSARNWPETLFVAVNVSPVQFSNADFVSRVARILRETGFAPQRLELEVTESAIVDDEASAEEAIIELRARGVRMALDDFGTGYSSLIYLRRFAFDKIKIDRSFLEALEPTGESAILVESIVHLGRSLGLVVTAEGIETPEQHRFLQALDCDELQGYLFSKPLPIDKFTERLDETREERQLSVA